jgi:hypothetical protein
MSPNHKRLICVKNRSRISHAWAPLRCKVHLPKLFTKNEKNLYLKIFLFIAGVVDTADKHSFAIISANFRKKIETITIAYSGARGTLIYEKKTEVENLVSDSI